MRITLDVNGRTVEADVAPRVQLADFLREHLLLTGTHLGCEHGICGACTVEINGEISRSCITYAVACDGAQVRTIEGFDEDPLMRRLRQAFTEEHALQCGFCTPGMLIAARDLIRRKGGLSRAEIRTEMSGNLCRCTGYMGLVNAIARVMTERAEFEQELARNANTWLGPAPGPVAQAGRPAAEDTKKIEGVAPSLRRATRTVHEPVHVTVGKIEEADGSVRLAQSFVLKHGRGAVWQLMSDPEAIARCMPGARLDGPPQDGRITGRIEVRLGPISASFAGEGTVKASPAEYRQVIEGRGLDRKSGSRVAGSVDYRLSDVTQAGEPGTQVDVVIGYALTGMLAQFGRSEFARDLALRIGESFAQNVDATLRDPSTSLSELQLSGLSLLYQVIAARVRALFGRIFGT